MRRGRAPGLLRSTPFRLALMAATLFIIAFGVAGAVALHSIRADLAEKLDRSISDTYEVMLATYSREDVEDLIGAVNAHALAGRGNSQVFLLTGPDGHVLAGNMSVGLIRPGWATQPGLKLGLPGEASYRTFTGESDGYRLTVGKSEAEISEINVIALTSFASAAAIVVVLALTGGAALALSVQRRIQTIASTMDKVSEGALSERIPLSRSGDDIDALSAQVNEALDRLEASFEGMRQVSVDIAHDLKTPLNRLRLVLDEATELQRQNKEVSKLLDEARAESDQINTTFDALLRIAQIESGARKSRFAPVDLGSVIADIGEVYTDVADDEGQSLVTRIAMGPVEVLGDRELLAQLFSNLVENAIRHTPDGTAIEIGVDEWASEAVAWVADNGPGIPSGERDKVLRRLYRLEESRTSPGSGLGLSLVKAVADLHGAALELDDNTPGLRVTLRFSLSRT